MQRTTARPGHAGGRTFRVQMRRRSILSAEDQALSSQHLLLYEDLQTGHRHRGTAANCHHVSPANPTEEKELDNARGTLDPVVSC